MKKNFVGLTLHGFGGWFILVLGLWLHSGVLFAIVTAGMIGYVRELEQAQADGGSRWKVWELSWHRHVEALAWPAGAAFAALFSTV